VEDPRFLAVLWRALGKRRIPGRAWD
jgi:hypothetical protein